MGIVLSIVYVLLENMLDTTIKTGEDIEKQFSVTVLASIPFDNSEKEKEVENNEKRTYYF